MLVILVTIAVVLYISLWYWYSLRQNDISLIDVAWGVGFVSIGIGLLLSGPKTILQYIITVCVALWGLRLSYHLAVRKAGSAEDARYTKYRKIWKNNFAINSYFRIFLLQGLFMVLISMPLIIVANNNGVELKAMQYFGLAIWLCGFVFEVIADYQLKNFLNSKLNRGKVFSRGLWSWSRHPNYFGEVVQWWGLWLAVVTLDYGLFAFVSPLTITWLIVFVSGIPPLEARQAHKPGYAEYKQRTSIFFPLPAKKSKKLR